MAILSDAQVQDLKNQWNNLSYDQQQAKLKANSWLQWALTNLWLTAKSNPNDSIINSSQVAKNTGNYTQQGTNFTIWGQTVWAREWSKPNANWTPVWWYTTPQGWSVLQDASPVDPFSSNSTWPKSILDKPTNNVTNFSVLGINPYGQQTTQNWNNTTNRTSVSTPRNTNNRATVTPQQQQWDYQDNSQARMDQIADNLDKYTITNPDLFKDYDSFYNFFIAGKGRSEDQIRFLDQYYADYKKNEKYKNLTPEQIGSGIANGSIPEDYISTVAATDPAKAEAIRTALNNSQDTIRNESYLSTLAEENWFEKWNREVMGYRDENNDWVDDWLYVAPTAEEQRDVNRINEIDARVMEIDNAIKNTYEDLRDRYPWAAQSTLMAMANDRNKNLQRERDDLMVEKTKLQWTVKYQQDERSYQMSARKDTISELQKNYWMYYDYSPEWIKERTQAQYDATHITLDQADNGTETDKKMALQWVLDGYYEKYWDIIQRPEQQVINDVIATAKKEWISLSDALEKNFLQYLRAKPEFASYSNWWLSPKVSFEKVWDNWYILTVNPDGTYSLQSVNWGTAWTSAAGNMFQYNNYTPITEKELDAWLQSFMSKHPLNSTWGECGSFVNDYLQSLWYDRLYTDPIDKKKAVTNSKEANVWAIAVMNSKKYPKNWHTAIVTDIQWDKVKLLESNWNDDKKVHERWVNKSEILGYFDPSKATSNTSALNQLNSKFSWPDWNPNGYFNSLAWDFKSYIKDGKLQLTKDQYASLKETYWINDQEFRQMAANYANSELKGNWWQQAANALNYAIKTYEYLYGKDYDWLGWNAGVFRMWGWFLPWTSTEKAKWEYESLMKRLSLKELFDAKALWATFWAMSDAEWNILENAATDLNWYHTNFKENLEDLIESLYDAAMDWNASLPKNYTGSSVETLINNRKSGWDTIWLTQEEIEANKKAQQSKFNAPKYATSTDLWWEVDWDAVWNS